MTFRGFSLIEILMVVVLIGILAAIAVPRFIDASEEAADSALAKDLDMVRRQIELFKFHHSGRLPGQDGNDLVEQLTERTDIHGNVVAGGAYGPYMPIFPLNPFTNTDTVQTGPGEPGGGNCGWHYNNVTGRFHADDTAHKDQ
jgi:prepilin-type N-terminal cleavage/methylation domain-containing protein